MSNVCGSRKGIIHFLLFYDIKSEKIAVWNYSNISIFKSQDSVIKVGTLILGGTVIFLRKN